MIIKAEEKDFLEIMFIYQLTVYAMNDQGLFNWNTAYPGFRDVLADIREGDMYIYKEDEVVLGVVCLNQEQPEEYEPLSWKYDGPFLVVHRLAVHPSFRNRHIGEKMMKFAAGMAKEKGFRSVRLDAITVNPSAMKLYSKTGYEQVGIIFFSYQKDPFMCMELKIDADPDQK